MKKYYRYVLIALFHLCAFLTARTEIPGDLKTPGIQCTAAFSAPVTTGCAPFTANFTDQSTTSTGTINSWKWYFGDGDSSALQNPSHIYLSGGNYSVKLIITTTNGDSDTLVRSNYIVAKDRPVVNLGNDTTICANTFLTLDAGNAGSSYLWSTGETTQTISVDFPGTYSVTVTGPGSCTKTDAIVVNLKPSLVPAFGFANVNNCLSQQVQFTDSSVTCGVTIVEWYWEFGDGSTSYQRHPLHVYTANGSYNVRLRVKDNTGTAITRSKTVIVSSPAPPDVNLGNDTTICSNAPLVLDAGFPGSTYEWSTGETTRTISVDFPDTYIVAVTNPNGCVGSDTITVLVTPALLPKFGWVSNSNCLPKTVQFIDSSAVCGVTIVEWAWDFGDGNTSSLQHPSHIYTANGTYIVKLKIKDNTGASITRSRSLVISAGVKPVVNLGADTTICSNTTLTLFAGNSGSTYLWNTGETTISIEADQPGEYIVTVTDPGGCESSDTINLAMSPSLLPKFGFSFLTSCLPQQVQFTDSSMVCGVSIVEWAWDFGDGNTSSSQHPLHVYTAAGSYIVKLKVKDNTGASITRSKTIVISAGVGPVVNIGADTAICGPVSLTLNAGNAGATYSWNTGETTQTIEADQPGEYIVTVTSGGGCSTSDTILISAGSAIIVNLGADTTICSNTTLTLDAGIAGATYLWNTGETTQTIEADQPGEYTVTVTTAGGCSSADAITISMSPSLLPKFGYYVLNSCLPQQVQFIDSSSVCGVTIVEWAWDFGDGNTSTDQHPLHTYTTAGSYIVKLKVKDNTGASITRSKTVVIVQGVGPEVYLGPDTTICSNTILTLDAGFAGSTYLWNTGETSQSIEADQPGQYIVVVTDPGGCSSADTINIAMSPSLLPRFGALSLTNCLPQQVKFTDSTAVCGVSIVEWSWDFGDGNTSNLQHPTHTYTSVGSFIVKLKVKDNTGASITRSKVVVITAAGQPIVHLGADTSICSNTTLTLNAGNAGATYLWNTGETTQTIEADQPGQYTVEVTSAGGCTTTDTITVSMSPSLLPKFGYRSLSTCLPQDVQFVDSSTTCGVTIVEWAWDFGDGNTSSLQHPINRFTAAGSYIVKLKVKDNTGATITRSRTVVIAGSPLPVVNLGADTAICSVTVINLDAGNPGNTYLWNTGETTRTIEADQPGTYVVTVFTPAGCNVTDSITISMVPSLVPKFGFSTMTTCLPQDVQFTDSSVSCGVNIVKWYWQFGDGHVSYEKNPKHAYMAAGTYIVKLRIEDNTFGALTISKTVVVAGIPGPVVNLGADTTICYGSSLRLDAQNAGATYLWNTGDITRTIDVTEDGKYWVTISNGICSFTDTISILTKYPLSPGFGFDITSKCAPVLVHFKDSTKIVCGSVPVTSWAWDFGDGNTSTLQNPDHTYAASGKFLVRLTVKNADGIAISKNRQVEIKLDTFALNLPDQMSVCINKPVTLDAGVADAVYLWSPASAIDSIHVRKPTLKTSVDLMVTVAVTKCGVTVYDTIRVKADNGPKPVISKIGERTLISSIEGVQYEWFKEGKAIENSNSQTLYAKGAGYYQVKVWNAGRCESLSDKYYFLPKGGDSLPKVKIRVKVSPNPSRGRINILLSDVPNPPGKVVIYDLWGRPVYKGELTSNVNPVNLSHLRKGYYLVWVTIGKQVALIPIEIF